MFSLSQGVRNVFGFSSNSEGGVELVTFFYVDGCRKHSERKTGGRFITVLGCRKHLLLVTNVFGTNYLGVNSWKPLGVVVEELFWQIFVLFKLVLGSF